MAYSSAGATDLVMVQDRGELLLTWAGTGPFQVYLAGRLVWQGYANRCRLPLPPANAIIDVGSVAASDLGSDLSASLPAPPGGGDRAELPWRGGTYLDPSIVGFNVYSGAAPAGAIDYTTPVDFVVAYEGQPTDGFGLGGFGLGGFGLSASDYSWTSGPLAAGTWNFGVKAVDAAGNEGTAYTWAIAIAGPPRPPAPFADGSRLRKSYDATTKEITLTWNPSP